MENILVRDSGLNNTLIAESHTRIAESNTVINLDTMK